MSAYFNALIQAVETAGLHHPVLVLDYERLRANLNTLRNRLPAQVALRLADKSLPVPDLLALGFETFGTERVMSFHLPLTERVLKRFPTVQALMGKPMPVRAAADFLANCPNADRVTWLIDNAETLAAYHALAIDLGVPLRIAFEVDIGLGRGGFRSVDELRSCQGAINNAHLIPVGLMGYEAHVNALPGILGGGKTAQEQAMKRLQRFAECLPPEQRQIINTGGSSTILGLPGDGPANDFTLGSLLVKPSDFDQAINSEIQPALFIVTPVLKTCDHVLPGHPRLSRVLRATTMIRDRIAFCYGGKWMAKPVHPAGLSPSPFFAASSNQHGLCLPRHAEQASHIVFRPTQSEAVLQQFSSLQLLEGGKISGEMAPFSIC